MRPSRRTVLKAVAASAFAVPVSNGRAREAPAFIVFDSRIAQSRAFAQAHSCRKIDIAKEDANFWRSLRTATPSGHVAGLTRWSDLVAVRGLLQPQGKRLISETRHDGLFRWTMA